MNESPLDRLLRGIFLATTIVVAVSSHAQQPPAADATLRYLQAIREYELCAMDYGRSHASVQATAGDIADAASIACDEKAAVADLIKPEKMNREFALERARRKTIHAVVEERAKAQK